MLACVHARSLQLCLTLCDPMDCSSQGSSVHGDSPGKNTGVASHFLLQGIFLIKGSSLDLLHCRQIFYHLSQQGNPYKNHIVIKPIIFFGALTGILSKDTQVKFFLSMRKLDTMALLNCVSGSDLLTPQFVRTQRYISVRTRLSVQLGKG